MALIPNNEDLTASSGLINSSFLESIYHTLQDELLSDLGRVVTFHLPAEIEEDTTTQGQPQSAQYNPFFGGVAAPRTSVRNKGTKITTQEVQYTAHIRINPVGADDLKGIGDLKDNEIQLTVVVEALPHVKQALSFTVEGRKYSIMDTRPVGFSTRRYLIIKGEEINEATPPTPNNTIG